MKKLDKVCEERIDALDNRAVLDKLKLTVIEINLSGKRRAYIDDKDIIYLDCKHCGIAPIENFGNDSRGFMKKRSECTPCRRRTKSDRDKIGTKTTLVVAGQEKNVFYYKVSQARRFAYKDDQDNIYFVCTVCGDAKHKDDFYNETGGLLDKKSKCKTCTDKINEQWIEKNPERYFEATKNYQFVNREKIRAQRKGFRENNKKKIYIQKKSYRERYKVKLYFKKKEWRGENKEKERNRIEKWHENNPHKQRYYSQLRLARKNSLPDTLTEEQLLHILKRYEERCCLSGGEAHLDHVIPLFIGHGGTTYENMLPLSPTLNGSKQDKNIFEWAELVHEPYGFTMKRFKEVITEVAERNNMTYKEYKEYYYWCFNNPSKRAMDILEKREKEKMDFLIRLEEAIEMYISGYKIKEIEEKTNISGHTIYKHLKKRDIQCNRR